MRTYDLDALAAAVAQFTKFVQLNPDFAASTLMIEQWPGRGVRERSEQGGAVPWREHMVLIAPALLYSRDPASTKLDDVAWAAGEKTRNVLVDGAVRTGDGHFAYVNYASGGEELDGIYGKANVERLRELKRVYDPENRFRFYAPLGTVDRKHEERDEL
ncbi:hypothetical protein IQ06DRAFT_345203 [Phaeosphaeriaceae sp. SRC1lsM3a]|nr:hypothetical protein IQ06DRAFT_345203 [Stagonospora sp. SRC1lsM3a]